MQHNRMPCPAGDELAAQRAVMGLVFEAAPKSLTIPELAREIDGAEHAIRGLVGAGLLVCSGVGIRLSPVLSYLQRLELP